MTDQSKKRIKIGLGLLVVLILGWYLVSLFSPKVPVRPSVDLPDMAYSKGESRLGSMSMANPMARVSDSASEDVSYDAESISPPEIPSAGETANVEKKVIKNGELTLKVDKVDESADKITAIAKENGGEISSSNFFKNKNNAKTGTITVKVPFNKFESVMTEIKKVATEVARESSNSQDVTEQYTDLQSQIKNKQAEEEALTKILSGAGKMEDVLKVTKELSRVRGEIERLQGQIRYMDSQADMSRININLSEDPEITATESWRPWQLVKDSANSLVGDSQGFVGFLIVLFVRVVPILILYLAVIGLLLFLGNKIYRRFKKPSDTESK